MGELTSLAESDRKIALDRYRILRSHPAWIEVHYGLYPVYMPAPSTHASISGIRL